MKNRIEKLSKQWFFSSPFLNEFIIRFSIQKFTQEEIKTMTDENGCHATIGICPSKDKNISLIYGEDFINKLNDEEFEGVILHEILHIITLTHFRAVSSKYDNKIWNAATDYTNNYEILNNFTIANKTMKLPKPGLYIEELKDKNNKPYNGPIVGDDIYRFLIDNNAKPKENFDVHNMLKEIENNPALLKKIEEIINSAKVRSYGNMSENMKSYIDSLLKPKIPIGKILYNIINEFTIRGDRYKFNTYKNINRKGFDTLPGRHKTKSEINIIVDVSGSISEKTLKVFFSEIDNFSTFFDINLIQFDTTVTKEKKYKKADWKNIEIHGRGGTDISCVFKYLHEKHNNWYSIIFTDGEFNWDIDFKKRKDKIFWVFTEDGYSEKVSRSIKI